jgi:hypothetical protein
MIPGRGHRHEIIAVEGRGKIQRDLLPIEPLHRVQYVLILSHHSGFLPFTKLVQNPLVNLSRKVVCFVALSVYQLYSLTILQIIQYRASCLTHHSGREVLLLAKLWQILFDT